MREGENKNKGVNEDNTEEEWVEKEEKEEVYERKSLD